MTLLRCVLTILSLLGVWHSLMARQVITLKNNPFQYSAMYTDNESRLQYLNARYYDPDIREFIQWDTYSEDDKSSLFDNRYNYGGGDPINNSDPSGHCIFPAGTGPFKDIVQAFDPYVPGNPAETAINVALMMPVETETIIPAKAETPGLARGYFKESTSDLMGEAYERKAQREELLAPSVQYVRDNMQKTGDKYFSRAYDILTRSYLPNVAKKRALLYGDVGALSVVNKTLSETPAYKNAEDIYYLLTKMSYFNLFFSSLTLKNLGVPDIQDMININRLENGFSKINFFGLATNRGGIAGGNDLHLRVSSNLNFDLTPPF